MQDDASFLGLNFSTRGKVKFFATTEWGVSLVRGGQEFNAGRRPPVAAAFPSWTNPQAGQVFGNRLGNVGVDFGPFGRITVGKQWGVHTDVSLYTTDQFVVFGSQASATYTAGTDGGFLGNGRADQAVSYHGTFFKVLRLGGQLQFRIADDSDAIDGAGVSAQVTILPGVRIGAAYTKSFIDDDVINTIRGLDGDAEFAVVGASINWKVFEAAVVYANQNNGDLARPALRQHRTGDRLRCRGRRSAGAFQRCRGSPFTAGSTTTCRIRTIRLIDPDFRKRYGIAGVTSGSSPTCTPMPNRASSTTASAQRARKASTCSRSASTTGSASRDFIADRNHVARTPLIILLAILYAGCAGSRTQPPSRPSAAVSPIDIDAKALEEFQEELDEYVELRNKLESQLPPLPTQAAPERVHAHEIALGDLIMSARRRAKQGDIFVSEVEPLIRARAQTVFASPEGAQDKAAIQDEQSERNVAARVNQRYPDGLPLSAVPASVLASLPRLPPELQYRFLGRHLILIDIGARIIVDYLPEVLPR